LSHASLAPAEISSLALHDALPISRPSGQASSRLPMSSTTSALSPSGEAGSPVTATIGTPSFLSGPISSTHSRVRPLLLIRSTTRSEEHTSELQSRENLVCRLLLEK